MAIGNLFSTARPNTAANVDKAEDGIKDKFDVARDDRCQEDGKHA
jgi:hypothetical protein